MRFRSEPHLVVSLGIEIENYFDAQSKLSREHLPKRSTQKPLFRRVCPLSPRREGNVRFPRSRHDRLNPRCFFMLGSIRDYNYRGSKNGARLILGKTFKSSELANVVLQTQTNGLGRGNLGRLAKPKAGVNRFGLDCFPARFTDGNRQTDGCRDLIACNRGWHCRTATLGKHRDR